ncbi:hypothetical protein Q9L58_002433 [Maublancomyces gigas]|uniref:Uncharacterized protein n=1 Tax=Discina gigas TaxID=1032678 RepID=A0ABR3GRF0_9PEZI
MVSFNTLAVCVSALASVCCARSGHVHMHRSGRLQARAGYNGTETTALLPIGTGVVPLPASTITQTSIKVVTVTYTLGNGAIKTATITKAEETIQTVTHVQSIVTVAPIIETTALASIPSFVSVVSVASVASVASPVEPKSTSTRTLVVTVNGSETTTVSIAAETAPPVNIAAEAVASSSACSVQTVYVPQYVTLYSTVTVAAVPSAVRTSITPPYSNNTITESSRSFESTSTTTLSVYTTVYVQPSAV